MITNNNNALNFDFFRNRIPAMLQAERSECGLICLAMVMRFYGSHKSLNSLRHRFKIGSSGVNISDLRDIASDLDFNAHAVRLDLSDIKKISTPIVLHWNFKHFVVLTRIKGKNFYLNDPALGRRVVNLEEFSKCFTGWALELKPTKEFERSSEQVGLGFGDILVWLRGFRSSLYSNFYASILAQIFILTFPFCYRLIVDQVVQENKVLLLPILLSFFSVLAIFHFFVSMARSREELYLGSHLVFQTTTNVLRRLFVLPMSYFEARRPSSVVSRVSAVRSLDKMLSSRFISTSIDAVLSIIIFGVVCVLSIKLALVLLVVLVVYVILAFLHYKRASNLELTAAAIGVDEQVKLIEAIQSMQTLKLFGKELDQLELWKSKYSETLNSNISISQEKFFFKHMGDLVFNLGRLLLMYLAISMVLEGSFTIGSFFVVFLYGTILITRARELVVAVVDYQTLFVRLDRVSDILLESPESISEHKRVSLDITGDISIRDLCFSYGNKRSDVFTNLNMEISAGEFIAIVGPSGCGKTTLLKLLLGLYSASSGIVSYNKNIKKHNLKYLRRQLGVVMQDDVVISGTIKQNIAIFDKNIDDERVEFLAKVCLLEDVINSLPMRYDTKIRQGGGALSGGQRQRLFLARALYHNPRVLFMDEGTSFLDVECEKALSQNLASLDVTRVFIAHRPESIRLANRIYNVAEQKFVEKDEYLTKILG